MFCENPYFSKNHGCFFPCRQCSPCRANRKRDWSLRVALEMTSHSENTFLTLTYDDDHLPLNGSLRPEDLTLLWKKLRSRGLKFRYFACGEYGSETKRPHYHAVIFGVDCFTLEIILKNENLWDKGFIVSVPATFETAFYVAGYVSKKINSNKDFASCGMVPEFNRCSRRPGIGFNFIHELRKYALVQSKIDVIDNFRIGNTVYCLPSYMKNKLRELIFDNEYIEKLKSARILDMKTQTLELIKKHFSLTLDEPPINLSLEAHQKENGSKLLSFSKREKILLQKRNKI